MLEISIPIQIALQVGVPLLLGWLLTRRYGRDDQDALRIFAGGAIAFGVAQAVLMGLSQAIRLVGMGSVPSEWQGAVSAIAFGLAIGILEELANFAVLRFWLRDVRSWAHGLMLGLGHGGAESAFSGIVGFIWYMTMSSLRAGPPSGEDISEAERAGLDQLVASFWSTSWPTPILAGLQQALLIVLSLGLATLVMRVFLTGKIIYLPTAMALHSLAAGSLVFAGQYGLPASLAASAMFAAIGLVIVRRFAEPPPALQPAAVRPAQAADAGAEPRPTRAARPRKKRAKKTS